jgi:hypothetical protein
LAGVLLLANKQHEPSPYVFDFSNDFSVPFGGEKAKSVVQLMLHNLYDSDEFIYTQDGPLGSHSIGKYGSTCARSSGASKDDKEYRGHWKRDSRHISDCYDGVLHYPDAKVAGMLCIGGPCSYHIKQGSLVTDKWNLQYVTPNIAWSSYGEKLASLLGRALLWIIVSDKPHWVDAATVECVKMAYTVLVGEELSNENPIEKKRLITSGEDMMLNLNEVNNFDPSQQQQNQQNHQQQQQNQQQQQQQQQFAGGNSNNFSNLNTCDI